MSGDLIPYDVVAIQTTQGNFLSWFRDYICFAFGQNVYVSDALRLYNDDEQPEQYFDYVWNGIHVYIKPIPVTINSLQLEFYDLDDNQDLREHNIRIIAKIKQSFQISELPFSFVNIIQDQKVIKNLNERWNESQNTENVGAWLSTIVLLGSILECLLYNFAKNNAREAFQSSLVPTDRQGNKLELDSWKLTNLIQVSYDLRWITQDYRNFADALREYRNLVHPLKQIRLEDSMTIDRGICRTSREVIRSIIEKLGQVR